MNETTKREALAEYAHEAWSGWMSYMFAKCEYNEDGSITIPVWAVERWSRQSDMTYHALPEAEKESDLDEADKILAIVGVHDVDKNQVAENSRDACVNADEEAQYC